MKLSSLLPRAVLSLLAVGWLSGCDSSTAAPKEKIVNIHDTTMINDRFARFSPIVHGAWTVISPSDTAEAWLFQSNDTVEALFQWKKSSSWSLKGRLTAGKDSLRLESSNQRLILWGPLTDSTGAIKKTWKGNILDLDNLSSGSIPSFTATRRH